MTDETEIIKQLRVEAGRIGLALWRNNSGAARDAHGRLVRYGLGNDSQALNKVWKSGDLIGIGPAGRFVACEVKPVGWRWTGTERETAQLNFINNVIQLGGIAGFCTCIDDYRRLIGWT